MPAPTKIRVAAFIVLCFILAAILCITLNSCSTVRKTKKQELIKVDSTAVSINTYQRHTKITETGADSIDNPVKPLVVPLDDDTCEQVFQTDLFNISFTPPQPPKDGKPGKKGKLAVNPTGKKLPVPPATKTTETKETGTNVQSYNKTSEHKSTESDKDVSRTPWWIGLVSICVGILLIVWLFKRK